MLYVFDVDGIICFDGKYIDSNILESIKFLEKLKNNKIIFVLVRFIRDLFFVVKEFLNNLLIGGNGLIIFDKGII